jgi:hypothetical protein
MIVCRAEPQQFRWCVWTCLILAMWWLSAVPAQAQSTGQICDGYPPEMSAQDLADATLKLKYNMPASRVRALLRVEVRNSDLSGPVAPYVEPTGKKSWVIYVPRGFRRLQCRLLQYQFYKIAGHIMPPSGINDLMVACARQNGQAKCFDQFVVKPASELEAAHPYNAVNASLLRQLADAAFDNVMMHEAAHIILRNVGDRRSVDGDSEVQADLLALAGSMGAGNPQMGAIATPAMMSLMDGLRESSSEDHPAAACRAADNDAIVREIGPQIGALFQWLLDPAQYPKVRSQPPSLGVQVWIPGDRSSCAPTDMAHTKAVRADLDRLLTILDGIRVISPDELTRWQQNEDFRNSRLRFSESLAQMTLGRNGQRGAVDYSRNEWERHPAERQFDQILEKLLGFAPQTAEGQRLRAAISSLWIAHWVVDEREPTQSPAASAFPIPSRWMALDREAARQSQILANLDRLNRSWAALTRYDIASEDYGRLLGLRAVFTYLASPPGSSIKTIAAQMLKSLNEADNYYSGSANALNQRAIAALLTGQCALARTHLKHARPLLDMQDRARIAWMDSIIASDDVQCAGINQELRGQLKRDLHWVD